MILWVFACTDPVKPAAGRESVEDDSGEVDSGETGDSAEPVVPCSDEVVVDVEAGADAGCVRRADGCLDCWSLRPDTGDWWEDGNLVYPPEGVTTAVSMSNGCRSDLRCGDAHRPDCWPEYAACAIMEDGEISCWGNPEMDAPTGPFASVSVGYTHACALDPDGFASCWGGTCEFGECSPPATVFQQLVSGQHFSCGLTPEGTVECWGLDETENCECATDESCWGLRNEYFTPWQAGPYDHLFTARDLVCGARGETMSCVSYYRYAEDPVTVTLPEGYAPQFGLWGSGFVGLVCGWDEAGSLMCESVTMPDLAEGFGRAELVDVSAGDGICGITTDNRLICSYYAEHLAWCPYCDEIWYPTE